VAERIEATITDVFQPTKGETWGVATCTDGRMVGTRPLTISVVGAVGMAKIGETLVADGTWVNHPTYGRQFKAETVAFKAPTKREPLIRFLASTVSGIGETRAAMIVDHFGTDAMRILDARPDLLRMVPGLPRSLVPKMVEAYKVARCTKHRDILLYLQTAGVGPKLAGRIVEKYGTQAEAKIAEDPYILMTDFSGVGFLTCDKIADQLGIPANDRRRVRAALVHHITEDCEGQGHTHLPTEGLVGRLGDKMRKTRDVETTAIRTYLKELLDEGTIVFEDGRLYLSRTHQTEVTVATRLTLVMRPLARSTSMAARALRSREMGSTAWACKAKSLNRPRIFTSRSGMRPATMRKSRSSLRASSRRAGENPGAAPRACSSLKPAFRAVCMCGRCRVMRYAWALRSISRKSR